MKKVIFNYSPEEIIKANLELQTTQNILRKDFGFNAINYSNIITCINKYKNWNEEKQNKFVVTLGGKANFRKTKAFIESRINV
jgi:hypothetical protein